MISIFDTTTTDRSAVSLCLLGSRSRGTRVSGADFVDACAFGVAGIGNERLGDERPTKAPAMAAATQAPAYVVDAAAWGAGVGRQKKQHQKWAFRGHEPWRDPA